MTALALHLWQSTLVLIAAWGLTRVCRRNAAEIRYWIWFCASLKFLVPFSLLQQLGNYLGRSLPAPITLAPRWIETGSALFVPSIDGVGGLNHSVLPNLTTIAITVWALGSVALLLRWLTQWLAMRSMLASAPYLPMDLPIPVRVTAAGLTPGVFGVFRPVLILPRAVMRELSASQIQTVLAHVSRPPSRQSDRRHPQARRSGFLVPSPGVVDWRESAARARGGLRRIGYRRWP